MSEIVKHIKIYILFVKNSIMRQMEYRVNFLIGILAECVYLASKMLYVYIVYKNGKDIGGLSPEQIMLFMGTFVLLTAIFIGIFMPNFNEISWKIQKGDLDVLIVKPISLQFYLTLREVQIDSPIPNIIAGITMICVSWSRIGLSAGFGNIIIYICMILIGIAITYSLFLIPVILSFWWVKSFQLLVITNRLWDFNQMPMQIYSKWIQRVGLFIIPIFVIINFPVMALFETLTPIYLVWGIIAAVLLFVFVRKLWNCAVKRYSSAGG